MADVDFRVKNGLVVDNGSISLTNTTSTSITVGSVSHNATGFYVGNSTLTTINLTLGGTITANGSTGTAGYMLMSAGSGSNVYWTTAPSGVAGSNTQIQYNNSGSLAGSAALTFNSTTNNISVANSATISGSLGIGTAPSGTTGEIRATNNITAYYSSDVRLKKNITPIANALSSLSSIRGVRFEWTDDYIQQHGGEDEYFNRRNDVGVIAQELRTVLPELVAEREDGFLAVKYDRIVALLIEAVKELKAEVDSLKQK